MALSDITLLDGGMGTQLQAAGLPVGQLPELWNLTEPEKVTAVHRRYVEAGLFIAAMSKPAAASSIPTPSASTVSRQRVSATASRNWSKPAYAVPVPRTGAKASWSHWTLGRWGRFSSRWAPCALKRPTSFSAKSSSPAGMPAPT